MTTMKAAVVSSFEEPPHYQRVRGPAAQRRRARSWSRCWPPDCTRACAAARPARTTRARGGCRWSPGSTPSAAVPMAPRLLRRRRRRDRDDGRAGRGRCASARSSCPTASTSPRIAAAMNPAMSSWVALRRRVALEKGQRVLVLGATGNAGTMAVQIATRLGAGGSWPPVATSSAWKRWRRSAPTPRCSSPATPRRPRRHWPRRPPRSTS